MEDVLITEHAGTVRDAISRFYQYGSGGVRVLDTKKTIKRLYLFEPSTDIMTERDPRRQEKILRRFVFDRFGMLEETFAFGERPRTFRYENGARQIAVREGGEYGAVGKIFTFEPNGITETAWGRNGEIERVYQVDARGDAVTMRSGGWYGDVERTLLFNGMGAPLFFEPEAFLQFLMFTEWSAKDRDEEIEERVAQIRGGGAGSPGRNPFAYTGIRHSPAGSGIASGQRQVPAARKSRGAAADGDIDFIPDGDAPALKNPQGTGSRRSSEITFRERQGLDQNGEGGLSRGRSAEIPLDERFENAQKERGKLSRGRSAEIPYDERRGGENR